MTGMLSLILIVVMMSLLVVFLGVGYWSYERKRRMQDSSISCPLTPDEMNILGLSYRATTVPANSYLHHHNHHSQSHHYTSHPTHGSVNSSVIHNKY